jgi:hypothetical protein
VGNLEERKRQSNVEDGYDCKGRCKEHEVPMPGRSVCVQVESKSAGDQDMEHRASHINECFHFGPPFWRVEATELEQDGNNGSNTNTPTIVVPYAIFEAKASKRVPANIGLGFC